MGRETAAPGRPARCFDPTSTPAQIGRLVAAATSPASGWLATVDAEALLDAYGIAVARTVLVRTPGEAEAAQLELGCTVVVKVAAAIHKSEVGGVRLGVTTPAAAADAVTAIRADLESPGLVETTEFLVQEQIESGQEMIVGVNHDQMLGPLVMVGLGASSSSCLGTSPSASHRSPTTTSTTCCSR